MAASKKAKPKKSSPKVRDLAAGKGKGGSVKGGRAPSKWVD
jgi:hypothetical protein